MLILVNSFSVFQTSYSYKYAHTSWCFPSKNKICVRATQYGEPDICTFVSSCIFSVHDKLSSQGLSLTIPRNLKYFRGKPAFKTCPVGKHASNIGIVFHRCLISKFCRISEVLFFKGRKLWRDTTMERNDSLKSNFEKIVWSCYQVLVFLRPHFD